eukprot:jgi/Bigna1/127176/aug1.4_g1884
MVRDGSKCFFRIGLYEPIVFRIHHDKKNPIPVYKRVVAGAMSGFAGAVICNPLDILKTRIQASGGAAGNHHSYKPTVIDDPLAYASDVQMSHYLVPCTGWVLLALDDRSERRSYSGPVARRFRKHPQERAFHQVPLLRLGLVS